MAWCDAVSTAELEQVIGAIRNKGVRLWAENGELRYRAPKGALSSQELELLRARRCEVVSLLRDPESTGSIHAADPRSRAAHRAPMTFTQLAFLDYFKLQGPQYARHSARLVTSAIRLRGSLDIDALQTSLAEVVRRHDALRTRIVSGREGLVQQIDGAGLGTLELADLSALPEEELESAIARQFESFVLQPIDLAVGPLFGVCVIKVRDREHVMVLAMDHLIADGTSLNILARDLLTGYASLVRRAPINLPPVHVQFSDYAAWQRSTHRVWLDKHGSYWQSHLEGCPRVRFPADDHLPANPPSGWGAAAIQIGGELKHELREWCRNEHTTIVMTVFTAYVALVLRWCNVTELVIQYQSNGRASAEVENTIGFFASLLHLRLRIGEQDTFIDLMATIKEEYCRAHDHADYCYLMALQPRPQYTHNSSFNWTPRGSRIHLPELEDGSSQSLECSLLRLPSPTLGKLGMDSEPGLQLFDAGEEISGNIFYPRNRFTSATMQRFGLNFLAFLEELLRRPRSHIRELPLR